MEEDILLKLENVEICREENRVLHDACLTLRNGEFVYVIGKVGSGKAACSSPCIARYRSCEARHVSWITTSPR